MRGSSRFVWIAASFLVVSIATRVGLALFSGEQFSAHEWASLMGVGLIFDLSVLPYFLLPWALYDAVLPNYVSNHPLFNKWENRWAALWASLFLTFFITVAVSEFIFWNEFKVRFDFIAVDYLVYTHEVIGNIWQSYPIVFWLAGILAVSYGVFRISWPRGGTGHRAGWRVRWGRAGAVGLAMALSIGAVDRDLADAEPNVFVQQLSSNGFFSFAHAFRNNEIDYDRYYPSFGAADLNSKIRKLVNQSNAEFNALEGIGRTVTPGHPPRKVNVVLISVESLSADYLGVFGNKQGLTPVLDKLAGQGLHFTNLFATGTRTVRGLEALSVGTPPIPGQSIVRRPNNGGLKNLGGELKRAGWQPYWIYGGYGFFDNMNAFFKGNGHKIVDRSDISAEGIAIHHETVWGVADEDLYSLAMAKLDQEHARGGRFFAHIMTTSNHRPYTFPENRVDWPQKRREGVVKYSDWAIGDFLKRAADKPWFDNTLFILTTDHTAKAAGKTDLPTTRYHIPMIWYAPAFIKPGVMSRVMSQVDIPPTLMGWLGLKYESRFFGYDIFNLEPGRERAFISTYQKLGYLKGGRLVVLDVNKPPVILNGLPATPGSPPPAADQQLIDEAIAWYHAASFYFRSGLLKDGAREAGG